MNKIKLFQNKKIRSQWLEEEQKWYFAVVDIVQVLTESVKPRDYWYQTKKRELKNGIELSTLCRQLKFKSSDGKKYKIDAADSQSILRIAQSFSSKKVEPLKRWLAEVGQDRLEENINPELAIERARKLYLQKGYSEEWISKRLKSIEIRSQLTEEWQQRGIEEDAEFAILTSQISKATFGLNPSEYKKHKKLKTGNLRDNMTDLELIFSMLGEASTKEIATTADAQGFEENKVAAKKGGEIAGNALNQLEKETGKKVVSPKNAKHLTANKKQIILPFELGEGEADEKSQKNS